MSTCTSTNVYKCKLTKLNCLVCNVSIDFVSVETIQNYRGVDSEVHESLTGDQTGIAKSASDTTNGVRGFANKQTSKLMVQPNGTRKRKCTFELQ